LINALWRVFGYPLNENVDGVANSGFGVDDDGRNVSRQEERRSFLGDDVKGEDWGRFDS
jgi:hypothetical protein